MSETIKDIVREMRRRALDFKGGNLPSEAVIAAGEDMEMFADRLEAAARNATMLCHQACSCEILAKMETENERLRAALKPVLECDCWISETAKSRAVDGAADAIKAVLEAQRIYKGMEK